MGTYVDDCGATGGGKPAFGGGAWHLIRTDLHDTATREQKYSMKIVGASRKHLESKMRASAIAAMSHLTERPIAHPPTNIPSPMHTRPRQYRLDCRPVGTNPQCHSSGPPDIAHPAPTPKWTQNDGCKALICRNVGTKVRVGMGCLDAYIPPHVQARD